MSKSEDLGAATVIQRCATCGKRIHGGKWVYWRGRNEYYHGTSGCSPFAQYELIPDSVVFDECASFGPEEWERIKLLLDKHLPLPPTAAESGPQESEKP